MKYNPERTKFMTHEELLHAVAPCSLMCHTCPALCDGAVCQTAEKLLRYFDGYYDFLDARVPPDNQEYRQMVKGHLARLEKYTVRPCPGCRENPEGHGCIEGCTVLSCVRETGREFCAECPDFPCQKTEAFFGKLDPIILNDWKRGTERIREIGPEAYYLEKKDQSHYSSFRKEAENK